MTARIDSLSQNLLINGLFRPYAQRLPSGQFNLTTSFQYGVLDRFMGRYSGAVTGTPTWEREGDYSKMAADFSGGAASLELQQRVESVFSYVAASGPISLGFEVMSESCDTLTVELYYPNVQDDWSLDTIIDQKVYSLTVGASTPLTWDGVTIPVNAENGLMARFIFSSPTVTGVVTNHRVKKTKMSVGEKAQFWSPCGRDLVEELGYCRRYFEKSAPVEVNPNTLSGAIKHDTRAADGRSYFSHKFMTTKRDTPSLVLEALSSPPTAIPSSVNESGFEMNGVIVGSSEITWTIAFSAIAEL